MKKEKEVYIIKSSGDRVLFNSDKLRASLIKSGAGENDIEFILEEIRSDLYENMPTRSIYKKAFRLLRKKSKSMAARYKLKNAIYELGPSGFPFEKYVAELVRYQGYEVKTGVWIKGRCVSHEVDVVAASHSETILVECKFHSDENRKCDVKVPLYIHSRYLDLKESQEKTGYNFNKAWIYTNTRFTRDAVEYGQCVGIGMVSWDYPQQGSLKERIDISGLHPVTSLTTLTRNEKHALLDGGFVLCKQVLESSGKLDDLKISDARKKSVLREISDLCTG